MTLFHHRGTQKCRICEFPALDTAVPVAQFPERKLSTWWTQKFDTEMMDAHMPNDATICQFCIWDAKFEAEHSEEPNNSREIDWWKGFDTNRVYCENYYRAQQLRRSQVTLSDLYQSPDTNQQRSADCNNYKPPTKNTNNKKFPPRTPLSCMHCDSNRTFIYKKSFKKHLTLYHSDKILQCNYSLKCQKIFESKKDLELHINKFHIHRKNVSTKSKENCIIRRVRSSKKTDINKSKSETTQKSQIMEKSEIKKENCADKDSSPKPRLVKCIYCKISLLSMHNLTAHVALVHTKLKIECSVTGCVTYFLTQLEYNTHFDEKHKSLKCTDCLYNASNEEKLANHVADHLHLHKCPECKKLFKSELSFKYHITFLCTVKQTNAFGVKQS